MKIDPRTNIYIDSANLHRASRELGFDIDYKRFYHWLFQKYQFTEIYFFIGYIEKNAKYYDSLKSFGYKLIFKETITTSSSIKGNCDAELVLKVIEDFYVRAYDQCIIVTGDGDFSCSVEFLNSKNLPVIIIGPNIEKFSLLLSKVAKETLFLNTHYSKFCRPPLYENEKTLIAGAPAE